MTAPVTVITPLHNGARYIERAIRTVRDQSFGDWRHIVVNDRSQDGGDVIARDLAGQDARLTVIDSDGPGAAAARNTGMRQAGRGRIAFLDCDDYWDARKLEIQLDHMDAEGLAFSWSSYDLVNVEGDIVRRQDALVRVDVRDLLTKRAVIGCLTAVYDVDRLGLMLMPAIRMRQDMCLFAAILQRCGQEGLGAAGLKRALAFYQLHDANMTGNKAVAAAYQWRAYREVFNLPLHTAAAYFVQYAMNSVSDRARAPGG